MSKKERVQLAGADALEVNDDGFVVVVVLPDLVHHVRVVLESLEEASRVTCVDLFQLLTCAVLQSGKSQKHIGLVVKGKDLYSRGCVFESCPILPT